MDQGKFPLQQGNLDFMCGTYAAINAMHIRGEISSLDQAAIPFRLAMMFMQSSRDWDLAQAICLGIGEKDYSELLEALSWRAWDFYPDGDYNASYDLLEKLEQLLQEGTGPVIVSLVDPGAEVFDPEEERDVIHYTVVKEVMPESLVIFDSQGHQAIERAGRDLKYSGRDVRLGYLYVMESK